MCYVCHTVKYFTSYNLTCYSTQCAKTIVRLIADFVKVILSNVYHIFFYLFSTLLRFVTFVNLYINIYYIYIKVSNNVAKKCCNGTLVLYMKCYWACLLLPLLELAFTISRKGRHYISGNAHPSCPGSFDTGHDSGDMIGEKLDYGRISGSSQHMQNNVLQGRLSLLIGQTALVVVIETIGHVQWRLLFVQAQPKTIYWLKLNTFFRQSDNYTTTLAVKWRTIYTQLQW